jgi:two-component system LytT family sensor kinase
MKVSFHLMLEMFHIFVFVSLGIYCYYRSETLFERLRMSSFNRRRLALALIFFCFYMASMPLYPCYNSFDTPHLYLLSCAFHVIRSTFFVFTPVYSISYIQREVESRNMPLLKKHIIIISSIFICLVSTNIWMWLLQDEPSWQATITWTFVLSLLISGVISAMYLNITYATLAQKRVRMAKELEISKLGELKTKAELEALQAKVNPHFLYNTLNSIAELSVHQGLKAREMTIALAELFRYSLNKQSEAEITVEEEMEMVQNYLMIEKIRFEDKLDVSIDMDQSIRGTDIPKFILQPLVENAVKHGLKEPGKKGVIRIAVKGNPGNVDITVRDNGLPFPDDIQVGYGLKSVMDKLALFYPGRYTIFFENTPFKQVTISLTNALAIV